MFLGEKIIFLELWQTQSEPISAILHDLDRCRGRQIGRYNQLYSQPPEVLGDLKQQLCFGTVCNPWRWYLMVWLLGCAERGPLYAHLARLSCSQKTSAWQAVYADAADPKLFRRWLKMLLISHRDDVPARFGRYPVASPFGYMSYCYLALYTRHNGPPRPRLSIKDLAELRRYYLLNSLVDWVVRVEYLEQELLAVLQPLQLSAAEQALVRHRCAEQAREVDYRDYYDDDTQGLVTQQDKLIIAEHGYRFDDKPSLAPLALNQVAAHPRPNLIRRATLFERSPRQRPDVDDLRNVAIDLGSISIAKPHNAFYQVAVKEARPTLESFRRQRQQRLDTLAALCQRMACQTFVLTTFNKGFMPLFRNWAASCDHHQIDCRANTIVFAMDAAADHEAQKLGFKTFFDGQSYGKLPEQALGNETPEVKHTRFPKLAMVQDILDLGYDVLMQDIDLVWFDDPVPLLRLNAEQNDLEFQFMRDINFRFRPLFYNSGFVYVRNNELARYAWQQIVDGLGAVLFHRSDQIVVNIVMEKLGVHGLRTERMPDIFVDGEMLIAAERGTAALPADKVVAHVNWTANLDSKIKRLRQLDMWYLDN